MRTSPRLLTWTNPSSRKCGVPGERCSLVSVLRFSPRPSFTFFYQLSFLPKSKPFLPWFFDPVDFRLIGNLSNHLFLSPIFLLLCEAVFKRLNSNPNLKQNLLRPTPPPTMSAVLSCGLECVVCMGCARWAWRRCTHAGARDSAAWPPASPADFAPVPRACRAVLASYEADLTRPRWAPARPGGYRMDPAAVAKRTSHPDTAGRCPPYMIYLDHAAREVVLAVRGLSLIRDADYRLLLDGRPGSQPFDGGYVHRGLLQAAVWLLNREADTLCRLLRENEPDYSLVLAGHSLGAGVAALMAVVVVNHLDRFGGIPRSRVRCYAIAPARCMSLNLAVKYADVIHSVVLQASKVYALAAFFGFPSRERFRVY